MKVLRRLHNLFIIIFFCVTSNVNAYEIQNASLTETENTVKKLYRGINTQSVNFSQKQKKDNDTMYYALVIGNDDYDTYPKLNTAIRDARAIADILRDKYRFSVKTLLNVTRERYVNALAEYRHQLGENDSLLIYYAGHGILDEEEDQAYWLPVDAQKNNFAKRISNATTISLINALPAQHVLLISDSCFSGKLTRGVTMGIQRMDYARLSQSRSRSVITSGGLEPVEDGTGKHSVFAKSLLSILAQNSTFIDATTLFSKLRRKVVLNSDQTPEFSDIRKAGHEGGEFVFSAENNLTDVSLNNFSLNFYSMEPPTYKNEKVTPESTMFESTIFSDTLPEGDIGPEMIVIPQGQYMMGDLAGVGYDSETPLRQVKLNYVFALSRYEVTFSQYDKFAKATGQPLPDSANWGRGDRPVINVSWNDAKQYAQWLSSQTNKHYRLPSEAEWEYAARAGTSTLYPWGNSVGSNQANCRGCQSTWDNKKTASVGSFKENRYGLHDMLGNVFEWTSDCWNPAYNGAPRDGSAWEQGDCSKRVIRGGAWNHDVQDVRPALRHKESVDAREPSYGFRLAVSMD